MKHKLQKWKCPNCQTEYWTMKGQLYLYCDECGTLCNWEENLWKINEEDY